MQACCFRFYFQFVTVFILAGMVFSGVLLITALKVSIALGRCLSISFGWPWRRRKPSGGPQEAGRRSQLSKDRVISATTSSGSWRVRGLQESGVRTSCRSFSGSPSVRFGARPAPRARPDRSAGGGLPACERLNFQQGQLRRVPEARHDWEDHGLIVRARKQHRFTTRLRLAESCAHPWPARNFGARRAAPMGS